MRGPEDVIDDKIWRILVEWCDAASRGDGADFRRWEARIGDYGNAALPVVQYVGSILESAVVERVGHAPDEEEIRELAVVLDPRYSRIVGGPWCSSGVPAFQARRVPAPAVTVDRRMPPEIANWDVDNPRL